MRRPIRIPQFGTRCLLLLVFIVSTGAAIYHHADETHRAEALALEALSDPHLHFLTTKERPFLARWLPEFIGRSFDRVVTFEVNEHPFLNEDAGLMTDSRHFTDQHVGMLVTFRKLRKLGLARTGLTTTGLEKLVTLKELTLLNISDTETDVRQFHQARPDCEICRSRFGVTVFFRNNQILIRGRKLSINEIGSELSNELAKAMRAPIAFYGQVDLFVMNESSEGSKPISKVLESGRVLGFKNAHVANWHDRTTTKVRLNR